LVDFDLILVGGGLASGLAALRLAERRPALRVAIVEAARCIGGDHIWSSFDADLTDEQRAWTHALYVRRWSGYEVRFPGYRRHLALGYASARSDRLDAAVRAAVPAERLLTGASATSVSAGRVTLADQRVLTARVVVDGRGQMASDALDLAWQKFIGHEIRTERPHGLDAPIVMDASVGQIDGYRFVYVLPWDAHRLLVEDTYFSDDATLDEAGVGARIAAYADAAGWGAYTVERVERGVLPLALGGDIAALLDASPAGVPPIGLRAGLFHPVTGYSFPDAVRTADLLAALPRFDPDLVDSALRASAEKTWLARRYYRMLNRLMFRASAPSERYRVLQHFYALPEPLVARFYAAQSTRRDKLRILAGRPPVPVSRALGVLAGLR
jgi:lycopene beta-cyclase